MDSPEISFGSSGSPAIDLCSTPVNHANRKRSFFLDDPAGGAGSSPFVTDSPMDMSGHYQASPQLDLFPTMSQEMRRVGVDVVWQWNSPKRNKEAGGVQKTKHPPDNRPLARKRRKSFSTSTAEGSIRSSGVVEKTTGFYKIREELLRAKKEDNLFMRLLQEEATTISTNGQEEEGSKPHSSAIQAKEDKEATLTRKLSDEFLNDSDNDENLLIVSQEMEKKVMLEEEQQQEQQQKLITNSNNNKLGGAIKTATSALQSREMSFTNDSFDQYLIDIPFDELLNRNTATSSIQSTLDDTLVNSSSSTLLPRVVNSGGGGKKGSLNRTQSMPPDTKEKEHIPPNSSSSSSNTSSGSGITTSGGSGRTMARHESMPMSSRGRSSRNSGEGGAEAVPSINCSSKFSVSNPSLPAMGICSSTESLYSAACKYIGGRAFNATRSTTNCSSPFAYICSLHGDESSLFAE